MFSREHSSSSAAGTSNNPGDNDLSDSIPTFPVFNSSGVLSFPGVKIALDIALPGTVNPGMVIARASDDRALGDEMRQAAMNVALELGGWRKNQQRKRATAKA